MASEIVKVKEVVVSGGEMVAISDMEAYRKLSMNEKAASYATAKKFADFFRKLVAEMEPLLRTQMDMARQDESQIAQINLGEGVKVHLPAGKKDSDLSQSEIEVFWKAFKDIDPVGAKEAFSVIHQIAKKVINEFRKERGEAGSMERRRSELIERTYHPEPKKLELKGL